MAEAAELTLKLLKLGLGGSVNVGNSNSISDL